MPENLPIPPIEEEEKEDDNGQPQLPPIGG